MPFDGNEHVAVAKVRIVRWANAFLFLAHEAPQLVRFHVAHFDVADFFRHYAFAFFADLDQQLENRGVVNFRGAFNARNGVTLEQETENHFCLFDWQINAV